MRLDNRPIAVSYLRTDPPLILTVGLDYPLDWDDANLRIVAITSKEEALDMLLAETVSVLVLGPRLQPQAASEILSACQAECSRVCTTNIVVGCGSSIDLFQRFVDE